MKLAQLSILAVLAIASQGAFAQSAPPAMAAPMAASGSSTQGGAAAGATDASSVTNVGSALVSDPTVDMPAPPTTGAPSGEMANTGGEPEIMLIAGLLLASGGVLLRRKTSAQSL